MNRSNLGAVRLPFLAAAVLASLSVPLSAQVVERGRTFADLTASHPCASGLTDRIARVTDCDAAGTIGDGGGAFNCWAYCDGSAPWADIAIGAGGGGLPGADEVTESMLKVVNACTDEYVLTCETTTGDFEWQAAATGDVVGPASAADNCIPTFNLTTGKLIQCNSSATISDSGDLSIFVASGSLALTVAQTGSSTVLEMYPQASGFQIGTKTTDALEFYVNNGAPQFIIPVTGGANLVPKASPPRTCDAAAEGDLYSDTSHALCYCDGTSWNVLTGSGAGSCA